MYAGQGLYNVYDIEHCKLRDSCLHSVMERQLVIFNVILLM